MRRVALGFVHKLFIWDLGAWPLYRILPSLGVAVKRSLCVPDGLLTSYMYFISVIHDSRLYLILQEHCS